MGAPFGFWPLVFDSWRWRMRVEASIPPQRGVRPWTGYRWLGEASLALRKDFCAGVDRQVRRLACSLAYVIAEKGLSTKRLLYNVGGCPRLGKSEHEQQS